MQTVFTLTPLSKEARNWLKENVASEPWQWLGNSLVIEHRYIADVVSAMLEQGFIPTKDFRV